MIFIILYDLVEIKKYKKYESNFLITPVESGLYTAIIQGFLVQTIVFHLDHLFPLKPFEKLMLFYNLDGRS